MNDKSKNTQLVSIKSYQLQKVEKLISITNKLVSTKESSTFDKVFCLLNSLCLDETNENYLEIIQNEINFPNTNKYKFFAKKKLDYETAIALCKLMILKKNNAYEYAYLFLGISKYRLKDYEDAHNEIEKYLELFPNSLLGNYFIGRIYQGLLDYDKAIIKYNIVIEKYPYFCDALFYRGIAKQELADYNGAISDYSKAIEIDSNNADAYFNRGIVKIDLHDFIGVFDDFSRAAEIDPKFKDSEKYQCALKLNESTNELLEILKENKKV